MGGKGQGQQGIHFADAADQGAKGSLPNGFFFLLQLEGDSPLGVSFLFFVKEWGYRVRFEFSGYFVLGVLVFLWSMSIFFWKVEREEGD